MHTVSIRCRTDCIYIIQHNLCFLVDVWWEDQTHDIMQGELCRQQQYMSAFGRVLLNLVEEQIHN